MRNILRYKLFNENVQQAKSLLKKYNIPESDNDYREIREMLKGMDGYVGFFIKLYLEHNVSLDELEDLLNIIKTEQNTINNLPIPLIQYDNYEKLIDDIEKSRRMSLSKLMYNELPSKQKSFISLDNDQEANILYLLSQRKDKRNFLKKVSSYHTKQTLLSRLTAFVNSEISANFKTIIRDLENAKADIKYKSESDNIIIAQIRNYEQCRTLGSDTSWCIARSEGTFRSYVPDEFSVQSIIYLTDLDYSDNNRKIGVTYNLNGYNTAHNVSDSHISKRQILNILNEYGLEDDKYLKVGKDVIKDVDSAEVSALLKVGYTLEEICEVKKRFLSKDLKKFDKELIDKYDLNNKIEINGDKVPEYSASELEKYHVFDRVKPGTLYIKHLESIPPRYIKKDFDLILSKMNDERTRRNDNRDTEKDKFEEFREKPDTASGYQVGSSYHNDFDLDGTLYKLRYFMVTPNDFNLDKLASAFCNVHGSEFKKIYDYIKINGFVNYAFDDKMPEKIRVSLINFFDKIRYSSSFKDDDVDFYLDLQKLGIDCKKELYEHILKTGHALYDSNLAKIKKLFKGNELDLILMRDNRNRFIDDIVKACDIKGYRSYADKLSINDFYKKWNTYIRTSLDLISMRKPNSIKGMFGGDGEIGIAIIAIYAKLNKLSELDHVLFDWKNYTFVKNLGKFLVGQFSYNSSMRIDVELTSTEKRKVYKLMESNLMQILESNRNSGYRDTLPGYVMQVLWYIYDKERFDEYFDECSRVKNNEKSTEWKGDKQVVKYTSTDRVSNLEAILAFLGRGKTSHNAIKKSLIELKELVAKMKKWNLSKDEIEKAGRYCSYNIETWKSYY